MQQVSGMLASIVAIVAVAGCGQASTGNSATPGNAEKPSAGQRLLDGATEAPPVDLDAVNEAYTGVIVDYEPVGPDELAKDADLIVTGSVIGFAPGPQLHPNDEGGSESTVIMSVEVLDLLQGAPLSGDVVHVLQYSTAGGAEALNAALPRGSRVGLYLQVVDLASADVDVENIAGIPSGSQVWAAGPQGFVVANGPDGGVVFPYIHDVRPNMSLDETLPR